MAKSNLDVKKLSGIQKAAIFLIAIGPERSSDVMKRLKPEEIELLAFEISRTGKVDSQIKETVLKEFNELIMAQDYLVKGGMDYAKEVLEKILGPQKAMELIGRLNTTLQGKPFDFVSRTDAQYLINMLQFEHPQTIALVLAYLDPKKGSEVLSGLPVDVQVNVTRRIAKMDRTNPEVIREVERVLERKLSSLVSEDYKVAGGVDSVVEVLNLADRSTERAIMENLEEMDPELAEEIKKRMFVFEDIVLLDDKSIQKVLREVENSELAKALKVVGEEVREKIYKNMSKRAVSMLKEDMDFMGPIRLNEVEDTQQKIVAIIRRLEESGEVVIARSGGEDILV